MFCPSPLSPVSLLSLLSACGLAVLCAFRVLCGAQFAQELLVLTLDMHEIKPVPAMTLASVERYAALSFDGPPLSHNRSGDLAKVPATPRNKAPDAKRYRR